jgi:uncharacterized protein
MYTSESAYPAVPVADLTVDARSRFIARTYGHLFGAIAAFTFIEIFLFMTGMAEGIFQALMGVSWLVVLGGFVVVSWMASGIAHRTESLPLQYAALGAFVLAQAIIFVPLLYLAQSVADGVIQSAALVTLIGFTGLTVMVFVTKNDFSFLGGLLRWGGIVALLLIVSSILLGFNLGTLFSVGMIALAGASILYSTSNILHHYPEDRYVGAALELFASVALMFWYVLRLFLARGDD